MKSRKIILLICVILSQSGQALYAVQKPDGSGELTIRVRSAEGPVEGASILLTSGSAQQAVGLTNSEGVCEFRALQSGTYSVKVAQRSFFPTTESEEQMNHLEIRNGQSRSLAIYLVKGGVLTGKVVDVDGAPIIGMAVSAVKLAGNAPSLPSAKESNVTAISDDRGEFRVYGLRQGSYTVAVNIQRNSSTLKSYSTRFYPAEVQAADATAFDLLPGQEVAIPDMVLTAIRVNQLALAGSVHGRDSEPLQGVRLSLVSTDGSQISDSNLSDETGNFSFAGLPAGQYSLKASYKDYGYFDLQRQIAIKDLAPDKVRLDLKPYPVISGRMYLKVKRG